MVTQTNTNDKAMMRKEAKGGSAPMTSEMHSEPVTMPPHKNPSPGQEARITRGAQIAGKPNQITRIDDTTYTVRSQSSNKVYEVISTESGWVCSCPDSMYRGVVCKHAHAVEISRRMREAVQQEVPKTTIKQVDLGRCKFCESANIIRKGIKRGKQQFGCKTCGKRFIQNLGFENKQATPEQITMAVDLVFSGLSTRKAAATLKMTGTTKSHMTVERWAKEYSALMDKFADQITPQVGERWRTDELYIKVRGNQRYLFAMLDSETRFWLAKMVAEHKGTDDVKPMFRAAKKIAGKIPNQLISDGAHNFAEAHKDLYAPKNFLWKDSEHVRHIHMAGDTNNNQMESFNGNTVRLREEVIRGLKREDSPHISGLRLYHNFVRPHQGLPDGQTPAEAAGIIVEGNNKWKTLIQAAAKANAETAA